MPLVRRDSFNIAGAVAVARTKVETKSGIVQMPTLCYEMHMVEVDPMGNTFRRMETGSWSALSFVG